MATLTTLVDGQVALVAPVNGNFAALNTDIAALRTQVTTGTADQVYRIPHAGGEGAFGNLHSSTLMSLGTGTATGRLLGTGYVNSVSESNVGGANTNLHTWTAAANTFPSQNGDGCLIRACGSFAANGNTKSIALWITNAVGNDGETLNLTTTAPNGKIWSCDLMLLTDGSGSFGLSGIVTISNNLGVSPTLERAGFFGDLSIGDISVAQNIIFIGAGPANGDVSIFSTVIMPFRTPS